LSIRKRRFEVVRHREFAELADLAGVVAVARCGIGLGVRISAAGLGPLRAQSPPDGCETNSRRHLMDSSGYPSFRPNPGALSYFDCESGEQYFRHVYGLRSRLVHGHLDRLSADERDVIDEYKTLLQFVLDVLELSHGPQYS
jgi:hypothetical protein